MISRDRFSVFELQQVFIFEKIERRNVLVRSFGLDRVHACSVVREKEGESLFCSIFVFLCLVVSIVLRFYQNSPTLLYSRALLVFRALLRALGFQGLL